MKNQNPAAPKLLYSTEDLCSMSGVCEKTIYRAVKSKKLARVPGFGHLKFTASAVAKYLGVNPESFQSGGKNDRQA